MSPYGAFCALVVVLGCVVVAGVLCVAHMERLGAVPRPRGATRNLGSQTKRLCPSGQKS